MLTGAVFWILLRVSFGAFCSLFLDTYVFFFLCLLQLHSLSFFVLDEADRMIQAGHFPELQSIIDMLPMANGLTKDQHQNIENCVTVANIQRKKRQTLVFSATIALSSDFRKKLKRGSLKLKSNNTLNSIEALSERAGMRANAAIIDLTNASILANKLEESFIEYVNSSIFMIIIFIFFTVGV